MVFMTKRKESDERTFESESERERNYRKAVFLRKNRGMDIE